MPTQLLDDPGRPRLIEWYSAITPFIRTGAASVTRRPEPGEPLLQKHGVQAYINGHDHDLQHIRRGGVDYICCGAGSEVRPVQAVEGTLFCQAQSGFAALRSGPETLTLEFRDFTGARLYRAAIPRQNAAIGKAA